MASTKDVIDSICNDSFLRHNKTFCVETLTAYPPVVSATNTVKLVKAAVDLGMIHAKKTASFVAGLEKEPTFKKYFKMCNESYISIVGNFRSARLELDDSESIDTASSDILVSLDNTQMVKDTIGKNTDKASKRLIEMTLVMEEFIAIGFGAVNQI
ncbi:Plant invertase/pectin methylesterase inhibitor superfamily protein [Raphanus sativus]|nr:Plant invertase/pectin methylesterase inhibitor superfamily protein [Raphanus sativus]